MNKKKQEHDEHPSVKPISLDPRYAAARPWDWCLCVKCSSLIPVLRCPGCGGMRFSIDPKAIIRQGLRQHGLPSSPLDRKPGTNGNTR